MIPQSRRVPGGPSRLPLMFLALILICASTQAGQEPAPAPSSDKHRLFARDNLIAWCIVPFDSKKRSPEERAAMLERLGFRHFAYDWRAEHIPTFDAEIDALERHGVSLDAFWVAPGELNRESRIILDVLKRHAIKAQLWVLLDLGADRATGAEQQKRVEAATAKLGPLAEEAARIGCSLALYNHGGWFGEPENQLAIIDRLRRQGIANVGIVYNLHHGHDHLDRLADVIARIKPYLVAINLNGMDPGGDRVGRKILPLGQGSRDLELLRIIRDSGYRGPIGILGHTDDDAEERLRDNLDGLDWLLPQLDGKPPGPRPRPRTPVPPPPATPSRTGSTTPAEAAQVAALIAEARERGNPGRGAVVFASPQFACLSCHRVGGQGGSVGPDLSTAGACIKPEEIAESLLWPGRRVKDGYEAVSVATTDGRVIQGYKQGASRDELTLRDPATGDPIRIARADIDAVREGGTLMPAGLAAAMTSQERTDLVRFLLDLGRPGQGQAATAELLAHAHTPASFPYDRAPMHPEDWPNWRHPVNRDRVYDFYAKEADYFSKQPMVPMLLPPYPGLDGGTLGHWGNQSDATWVDSRWNQTDLGTLLCGVFRGAGVTVPKAVCVRLGDRGELAACFNPETLCYEAVWRGGFLRFDPKRHGLLDGLILNGTPLPRPEGKKPDRPFVYHGFYRHGNRVVFSYRIGDIEMLDAPWVERRPVHPCRRAGRRASVETVDAGRRHGAMAPGPDDPRPHRPFWTLCDRHRRAAVRQPVEGPPVLRRPRLPPRRHGNALHHGGGCLEREGTRRDAAERAVAPICLRAAPGAGLDRRGGQGSRPGPRSDHPPARSRRRRRGRLLRVRQQHIRDLARRARLRQRPAARRLGPLLCRLKQTGTAADHGQRPRPRDPGDRLPQPRRPGPHPERHGHGPLLRGRLDARIDGLRDQAGRPLWVSRAARGPAARSPAGLPAARPGQFEQRPGHRARRPLRAAQGTDAPLLVRHRHVFPTAARKGRRSAAGRGGADARRVPLGRAPRPFQPSRRPALCLGHDRLGHLHAGRRLLPAGALHRRARAASAGVPRARERRARAVLAPTGCRNGGACEGPFRPGVELPIQLGLRIARALAEASGPAGSRRAGDPLGARPGRRPDALPRDPRLAARQPAPSAPAPGRRTSARPLSRRSTGCRPRSAASRATGRRRRRSPPTRSWPTWPRWRTSPSRTGGEARSAAQGP